MRFVKMLVAASAGAAVIAAVGVGTAAAAPKKLDLTWAGTAKQLEPGQELRLNNVTAMTAETGSGGLITCTANPFPSNQGWTANDETNNTPKDELEVVSAFFSGFPCENNTSLGASAGVEFVANGDQLVLASNGVAEVKAPPGGSGPSTDISYSGGDFCAYFAKKIKGSITLVPAGGELNHVEINFSKQKEKLDKALSSATCPKAIMVNAPFQFQTTGGESVIEVFGKLD
jgi:hypothetical protein